MGKGDSEKPAFEQYREQIEWENSSSRGYLGKRFNSAVWKIKHSPREIFFIWAAIIGAILFFLYTFFSNYDSSILPFIILPAIAGIIIFFAIRDGIKEDE
ncbi:MAG: hypothetical protein HN390_09000 [Anaerolineae bacterium]|jgi:hypothetical protein|nr:hypothetical protein [Anaerolineae bacterium]MBT7189807.1 hypothetical protein [Anaerolineae bacterium]MBT7988693.1 hypothetical protein [Anaerolineae bacterium]